MKTTPSHEFNRQVGLERAIRTPNGAGGFTKSWANPVPVWAKMVPLRGGEAISNLVERAQQLWKITIRWRDDIGVQDRLVYQGKSFNIRSCEDQEGDRRELVMTCETGVNS